MSKIRNFVVDGFSITNAVDKKDMRYLLISLGIVAVILGSIGVVVPGLPTTPFMLLASWLFYKSSPRLRTKLHDSWFGKYIKNYEKQGGLSFKGKLSAILLMIAMVSISIIFFIETKYVKIIVATAGLIGSIVVGCIVPTTKKTGSAQHKQTHSSRKAKPHPVRK
jgi:uncharacterized membrane protein YbaN (DUF454 family)